MCVEVMMTEYYEQGKRKKEVTRLNLDRDEKAAKNNAGSGT